MYDMAVKMEYKIIVLRRRSGKDDPLSAELNTYADQGWRVKSAHPDSQRWAFVLEREKWA